MAVTKDGPAQRGKRALARTAASSSPAIAAKAIDAIIAHHRRMQNSFRFSSSRATGSEPTAPDLADAARVIGPSLHQLDLTTRQLLVLLSALDSASDRDSASAIRACVRDLVDSQWAKHVGNLRDGAIARLLESKSHWDFENFITAWPRLRSDSLLRSGALDAVASDLGSIGARLMSLHQLDGDLAAAQRVLFLCMNPRAKGVEPDDLASLIGRWAGHTPWGQLHHRLWWLGEKKWGGVTSLPNLPAEVTEAAQHLEQLLLTHGRQTPDLRLSEMAPESRAAWRRMLDKSIGTNGDLRVAVAEALLWYTAPSDDRLAQLAVIELYGRDVQKAMIPFREHGAYIVCTRAESILGLVEGRPNVAEVIDAQLAVHNGSRSRTWIDDARVEQMIEGAIATAANGYAREFENTADSGEETHVANLFRDIRHQLAAVNHRIAMVAAECRANSHLVLRLDYRIVGKHEEGGPGIDAPRFSTDICLVIQAQEGTAPPFARRVSFLQAKRLHVQKGGAIDIEHYPIKQTQLEDLAAQTESSYLLLIGPTRHDLAMPILPARLVLDLIARDQIRSSLYPAALPAISRSLPSWLTYEAIGLWTGDWAASALQRAEGVERRRPFLLVEITAEMRPMSTEQ